MRKKNRLHLIIYIAVSVMLTSSLFTGCSSTSALKEGEQLFAGLKPIEYTNYEANPYADSVKEEMEYALASAPTGAFMGSSYYRTPFPIRLWVWNAFSQSEDGLSRWITKVFGSKPKLMANVNPQLRAQVAEHQLDKLGYFNGKVDYEVLTQSNPKEAKVAYKVDMGHLWRLDSIAYLNFPEHASNLSTQPCRRLSSRRDVLSRFRLWSRSASDSPDFSVIMVITSIRTVMHLILLIR